MDQNILTKSYKLNRCDNFELFLKEVGAPRVELDFLYRERPIIQLRKCDGVYVLDTGCEHSKKHIRFQPDRIFVQDGYSGKKVQTVMSFDGGNILKEVQYGPRPVIVMREFSTAGVKETMACRNVVCHRYYCVSGY